MAQNVLIITGMHRSGTSLVANWLQTCGLHIGTNLLSASLYNPKGFYEDTAFVALHMEILKRNRVTYLLPRPLHLKVDEDLRQQAVKIITGRRHLAWGWKDPRTTLVLPFWYKLIPQAKFLFLFRNYDQVVDSLHRRIRFLSLTRPANYIEEEAAVSKDLSLRIRLAKIYQRVGKYLPRGLNVLHQTVTPSMRNLRGSFCNLVATRVYVRNWAYYNQMALEFYRHHREQCLYLSIDTILTEGDKIIRYINNNWDFDLSPMAPSSIYEPNSMKREVMGWKSLICEAMHPQVKSLFRSLQEAQKDSLKRLNTV